MNSEELEERVRMRLASLTKPPGSLGMLEDIAVRFAVIRGEVMPSARRKGMYIFCADHGITEENVSRYPRAVTRQMLCNFVNGGAAITVLCRALDIRPVIIDAGVEGSPVLGAIDRKIGHGTNNFANAPAMTRRQAEAAIEVGREQAEAAISQFDVAGVGEMGIGNTTAAAALFCAFTGIDPAAIAGSGTGLTDTGVAHKAEVIRRALALYRPDPLDPIGVLAAVGGFEIGAIAGFILRASELRLPVVADGFPSCAGAVIAKALRPAALASVFFGHVSAERGHRLMLETLSARPLLSLGMRLGEGTGAALAMGVIDCAIRLYSEMASFGEAGVDGAR